MIKRIKIQEKRTMTREEFITLSKDHIYIWTALQDPIW